MKRKRRLWSALFLALLVGCGKSTVDLNKLVGEYNANKGKARETYHGNEYVFRGRVTTMNSGGFEMRPEGSSTSVVRCVFEKDNMPQQDLGGKVVLVRGTCNSMNAQYRVSFINCELLE